MASNTRPAEDRYGSLAERKMAEADAEKTLLATCIRHPACMDDIAGSLQQEHFATDDRRRIWSAMLHLYTQQLPCDLPSVGHELRKRGDIAEIGGYGQLAELYEHASIAQQVQHWAGQVREYALYRELGSLGLRIHYLATNPTGSAQEMLQEAERDLLALAEHGVVAQTSTLADALDCAIVDIKARVSKDRTTSGLLTGIGDLDAFTAGLHPGEMVLLAARPSVGKTAMALTLTRQIVQNNHPVLFASLEQSALELAMRLLSAQTGIEGSLLRQGTINLAEMRQLEEAACAMMHLPLAIDDAGEQGLLRIAACARRLKRRKQLELIVVDYLQLVAPEDRKIPRHEQVASISRRLKGLARELSVPVVALAQLNRESENRANNTPRLSDLRESGSLEADADVVILLHKPPEEKDILRFIIAKQRNGPVGEFDVRFDRARMRIFDLSEPEVERTPFED